VGPQGLGLGMDMRMDTTVLRLWLASSYAVQLLLLLPLSFFAFLPSLPLSIRLFFSTASLGLFLHSSKYPCNSAVVNSSSGIQEANSALRRPSSSALIGVMMSERFSESSKKYSGISSCRG